MNILSFDIGMKNLAFCYMRVENSSSYKIKKWDVINLCKDKPNCNYFLGAGSNCNKEAVYCKADKYYCKKHATSSQVEILSDDLYPQVLKKNSLKELIEKASSHGIPFEKPTTKMALLEIFKQQLENKYLTKMKADKTEDYDLIQLGISMKNKLDDIFSDISTNKIDVIVIENQISPLASRMKTLQGMLAQYFIMRDSENIIFYSASNKLKLFSENQQDTTYAERKKLSIMNTGQILEASNGVEEWNSHFLKHKKKDDLADSFLQGLSYLMREKLLITMFSK